MSSIWNLISKWLILQKCEKLNYSLNLYIYNTQTIENGTVTFEAITALWIRTPRTYTRRRFCKTGNSKCIDFIIGETSRMDDRSEEGKKLFARQYFPSSFFFYSVRVTVVVAWSIAPERPSEQITFVRAGVRVR